MPVNNGFHETEIETKTDRNADKVYTCDEAITLAGTGGYTKGLLAALSVCVLSMGIDMFGFSVVVTGCACDFQLDHTQKSLLMSMPFVGPIIMSYIWGYLSDTRGRRWSLLLGLWGAFAVTSVSAFSPHWVVLAVLKIVGTSFSSCAQSSTYTYLGESCPQRIRGSYSLIMTSVLMLFLLAYDVPAYFILNLDFSYDWGFLSFTPWRLLTLVLAAPLGVSALSLHFFCESPKFLINAGKHTLALENLNTMWRRNGNPGRYPVTSVVLNEESSLRRKDVSMLASLFDQILPLFKLPLLWRTLQLFYLTTVIYSINSGLVMWMPLIVEAFTAGLESSTAGPSSLCDIIVSYHSNTTANATRECVSSIDTRTLMSGIAHGLIFSIVTLLVSKLGHRKRFFMITLLCVPLVSCVGAVYNNNNIVSLVLYVGMISTNFCMGFLFGYYVELYPTSYRGMAACLGVMVSRLSGLAGVYFLGALIMTHCSLTLLAFAVYVFSGIVMAYFLPPDENYNKTSLDR